MTLRTDVTVYIYIKNEIDYSFILQNEYTLYLNILREGKRKPLFHY